MKLRKHQNTALCASLLVAGTLTVGCMKTSTREAQAPATPAPVVAARTEQPAAGGARDDTDPVTRIAYKTSVPRDKVQEILDLYVMSSKANGSGRDVYNIALLASQRTGIPTEDVGSVILAYRSLFESTAIQASQPAKPEAPKG
ncbi:MAG: hypothetical protein HZB55_20245 [Deltaproteobacteria bacterium]|nr:hypothetical protein [Deltaproteobacteria bacterium]